MQSAKTSLRVAELLDGVVFPECEQVPYELEHHSGREVWLRRDGGECDGLPNGIYEARMVVEFFEKRDKARPFSDHFRGNYVVGRGVTREKAIELMILDWQRLMELMW